MREIDYKALRFLINRSSSTPFQKTRELKKLEKAWKGAQRGKLDIELGKGMDHQWYLCEARFFIGDYSDWTGWEYRDPWATTNWLKNTGNIPIWSGKKVKRLYVVGEQGLGDEVLFAQTLFKAKEFCDELIFETQPRLVSIFERCFPATVIPADLVPHPSGEGELRIKKDMDADEWVTLGELCRVFLKGTFERRPYLFADPSQIERFKKYKGRTGISWRGRQGTEKHIISAYPEAVSLQYGQTWDEGVETPEGLDLKDDLEGVLGLLANLSEVITVSTSVAHFASAMGVPTTVIIAEKGTGDSNLIPWKWHADNLPNKTWWYGDTTRTYDSWGDFIRHTKRSGGPRVFTNRDSGARAFVS